MGNSSSSLLKKALGSVILIAVAIVAFKIMIAVIAGLVQTFFAVVLVVLVVFAVAWAVRRL